MANIYILCVYIIYIYIYIDIIVHIIDIIVRHIYTHISHITYIYARTHTHTLFKLKRANGLVCSVGTVNYLKLGARQEVQKQALSLVKTCSKLQVCMLMALNFCPTHLHVASAKEPGLSLVFGL